MRPRKKRPRPAMSDTALERWRARAKLTGLRALLRMEERGYKIDWSQVEGGRPANPEEILATKPAGPGRV